MDGDSFKGVFALAIVGLIASALGLVATVAIVAFVAIKVAQWLGVF